jgi:hypothetical protein
MSVADAWARLIQAAERYERHSMAVAERRGTPLSRADADAMHQTCLSLSNEIRVPDLAELDTVENSVDLEMLDYVHFRDARLATLADAEKHCALQRREIEVREAELQLCALSLAQTEYALALAKQAGLPPTATLGDAIEAGWKSHLGVSERSAPPLSGT